MTRIGDFLRGLGVRVQKSSQAEEPVLHQSEVRLIYEGKLEDLAAFALSPSLHLRAPNGDTPLHVAARMGSLVICDLFVRSGADPRSLNNGGQSPADVANAQGHGFVADALSTLVSSMPAAEPRVEATRHETFATVDPTPSPKIQFSTEGAFDLEEADIDTDDLLSFEAESDPEEYFNQSNGNQATGFFAPATGTSTQVSDDGDVDWDLDLSAAPITGDGIGESKKVEVSPSSETGFLEVRSGGRFSTKPNILQTSTRVSIPREVSKSWAENLVEKGWCSFEDIDQLVACCNGNGDADDLKANLQKTLESLGFNLDQSLEFGGSFWDTGLSVSTEEIAEAIEATLMRATRLPGTQRFNLSRSDEEELIEQIARAKQELQIGILGSELAIRIVLNAFESIRAGTRETSSVSFKILASSRLDHPEMIDLMAAAETLNLWYVNGRAMEGKRRREALGALATLDLSSAFELELIKELKEYPDTIALAQNLEVEMRSLESAMEQLVVRHLPYVRRFASRNVKEDEDIEDVFQVAFIALQRSLQSFDPKLGYRLMTYASYGMRQAVARWRADEGAEVRIPVHRLERIERLDRALDKLDVRTGGYVSQEELALELSWTTEEVELFQKIPREVERFSNLEDWDKLLVDDSESDGLIQSDIRRIVTELLDGLPPRHANVIRMRFGIGYDSEMTLAEVGSLFGVTRERIRQIESKVLGQLRRNGIVRKLKSIWTA